MRTSTRRTSPVVETLFGLYRRRVLSLLLLRPDEALYVREIARLTDVPAGSLHRELKLLTDAGLLTRSAAGNTVRYQVDRSCPMFEELAAIFRKASEPREVTTGAASARSAQGTFTPKMAGALARHRRRIANLCRRHRVKRLDLVGSATRADFNAASSDVDFMVEFLPGRRGPDLDQYLGLKDDLERLIGRSVDLIMTSAVSNPYVMADLARDRVTLYAA